MGDGEGMAKRWHKCHNKSRWEMKVLRVVSGESRADVKEQGRGVDVAFQHRTGRAKKQTLTKKEMSSTCASRY